MVGTYSDYSWIFAEQPNRYIPRGEETLPVPFFRDEYDPENKKWVRYDPFDRKVNTIQDFLEVQRPYFKQFAEKVVSKCAGGTVSIDAQKNPFMGENNGSGSDSPPFDSTPMSRIYGDSATTTAYNAEGLIQSKNGTAEMWINQPDIFRATLRAPEDVETSLRGKVFAAIDTDDYEQVCSGFIDTWRIYTPMNQLNVSFSQRLNIFLGSVKNVETLTAATSSDPAEYLYTIEKDISFQILQEKDDDNPEGFDYTQWEVYFGELSNASININGLAINDKLVENEHYVFLVTSEEKEIGESVFITREEEIIDASGNWSSRTFEDGYYTVADGSDNFLFLVSGGAAEETSDTLDIGTNTDICVEIPVNTNKYYLLAKVSSGSFPVILNPQLALNNLTSEDFGAGPFSKSVTSFVNPYTAIADIDISSVQFPTENFVPGNKKYDWNIEKKFSWYDKAILDFLLIDLSYGRYFRDFTTFTGAIDPPAELSSFVVAQKNMQFDIVRSIARGSMDEECLLCSFLDYTNEGEKIYWIGANGTLSSDYKGYRFNKESDLIWWNGSIVKSSFQEDSGGLFLIGGSQREDKEPAGSGSNNWAKGLNGDYTSNIWFKSSVYSNEDFYTGTFEPTASGPSPSSKAGGLFNEQDNAFVSLSTGSFYSLSSLLGLDEEENEIIEVIGSTLGKIQCRAMKPWRHFLYDNNSRMYITVDNKKFFNVINSNSQVLDERDKFYTDFCGFANYTSSNLEIRSGVAEAFSDVKNIENADLLAGVTVTDSTITYSDNGNVGKGYWDVVHFKTNNATYASPILNVPSTLISFTDPEDDTSLQWQNVYCRTKLKGHWKNGTDSTYAPNIKNTLLVSDTEEQIISRNRDNTDWTFDLKSPTVDETEYASQRIIKVSKNGLLQDCEVFISNSKIDNFGNFLNKIYGIENSDGDFEIKETYAEGTVFYIYFVDLLMSTILRSKEYTSLGPIEILASSSGQQSEPTAAGDGDVTL